MYMWVPVIELNIKIAPGVRLNSIGINTSFFAEDNEDSLLKGVHKLNK